MNNNKKRFENISKDYKNAKEYKVHKECELLDFLLSTLVGQSRNAIKGLLSHHLVSVDGAPISQFNFKLYKDDVVLVSKTPIKKKKQSKLPIIYEDEEMIVIDKPSGLLTIPSDKEKGKTVYRLLTDYVQLKDKHNRIFIVHRLDEDTSGVLIVAKNDKIRDAWQNKWNELVSDRGYYAIVEGKLKTKEGTVKSYLKSNSLNLMYSSDDKKNGQFSITHYKVIDENDDYSLVDVHIDSGRKNQIRVHMGDLGHHVIGDDKYGKPKNPLHRLGLHAYSLVLKHPISGKELSFKSPIPKSFLSLMKGTWKEVKKDDRKEKGKPRHKKHTNRRK
ncbi:MAG: RluA family pseudouridine synthase [Erysipelotrichaceae bacterium]|jgi:23S rRNA pseudouridine1911/1915/1917 synthase|nr:RluA family pseudouridine synthase [Erysipelotrichaceae bacterium]